MRLIVLLFVVLIAKKQVWAQGATYDALSTIYEESKRLNDSLVHNGVDTLISYYQGAAGCPASMSPICFMYWVRNDTCTMAYIKEVERGKKKKRYTSYKLIYHLGPPKYPIYSLSFLKKNYDRIKQDSVRQQPAHPYVFNYIFEEMHIRLGVKEMKYNFATNNRPEAEENYKVALIDDFLLCALGNWYLHNGD